MSRGRARGASLLRGVTLLLAMSFPATAQRPEGGFACVPLDRDSIPGSVRRVSLSRGGAMAALETDQGGSARIFLIHTDAWRVLPIDPRQGREGYSEWHTSPLALMYETRDEDVQWNPAPGRESWIAFVSNGVEGREGVWLCNTANGRFIRLTDPSERSVLPRWSADGNRLFFFRATGGVKAAAIFTDLSGAFAAGAADLHPIPDFPGALEPAAAPRSDPPVGVSGEDACGEPIWNGSQEVLLPFREGGARPRSLLFRYRIDTGILRKDPLDSDALGACAPIPGSSSIAMAEHDSRNGRTEIARYILRTGREETIAPAGSVGLEEGESILRIDPLAPGILFADVTNGKRTRLCYYSFDGDQPEEREVPLPANLALDHVEELRAAAVMPPGSRAAHIFLTYRLPDGEHACRFDAAIPAAGPRKAAAPLSPIALGGGGGSAHYDGGSGGGDYRPQFTADIEVEPAGRSMLYWKIGIEAGYAEIAKSVSIAEPFTRSYAYGEAYMKAGWRIGAFRPFLSARIGKGLVNLYYPSGARRMPNHLGWGAGADLALSSRAFISLAYAVRSLNVDLTGGSRAANDRFSTMTAGIFFHL